MKISLLLALPLLVDAAVVRSRPEHIKEALLPNALSHRSLKIRDTPANTPKAGTWTDSALGLIQSAYSAWNSVNDGYQALGKAIPELLPGYLSKGVNGIVWYMQWAAKPVSVTSMKPELDPAAKKRMTKYGPFVLMGQKYNRTKSAMNMDPKADILIRTLKGLPDNSALLSGRLDAMMEDGARADISKGIYIHHLLVADVGKATAPFAMCPNGQNQESAGLWLASHVVESIGAGLIQSGNDQVGAPNIYAATRGDKKAAFLTGWDDNFLLEAEIVNYNQENTTIYLTMETEYLDTKPAEYLDTSTILFSATGCGMPGYRPPQNAKQYNFTSEPFTMNFDGWIINSRGHLHDGGTAMQMTLNGNVICESTPTYGGSSGGVKAPNGKEWQTITSMSRCEDPMPFKKHDVVKLVSIYDTDKHPLRPAGGHKLKRDGPGGHGDMEGGMEGMDEMGIFTTNIAISNPKMNAVEKPGSKPQSPTTPQPKGAAPAGAANMPGMNMPGMDDMKTKKEKTVAKVLSKRYGMIDLPEAAWPVAM